MNELIIYFENVVIGRLMIESPKDALPILMTLCAQYGPGHEAYVDGPSVESLVHFKKLDDGAGWLCVTYLID